MTFKSIADDILSRFASLDIIIEPEESAVREAVNRHRARNPDYFKGVKKIVVEHNTATPYVGKATGDGVIHVSIDAIRDQLSKAGLGNDMNAFSEEVYKTLAHEVAHITGGHDGELAGESVAEGEEARMGGSAPTIRSASLKLDRVWSREPWIESAIARQKSLRTSLAKNKDELAKAESVVRNPAATVDERRAADAIISGIQPVILELSALDADLAEIQRLREALFKNSERSVALADREKIVSKRYSPEDKAKLIDLVRIQIPTLNERISNPTTSPADKAAAQTQLGAAMAEANRLRNEFGDAQQIADAIAGLSVEAERITAQLDQFKAKYESTAPVVEHGVVEAPAAPAATDDFVIDEEDAFVLKQSVESFKMSVSKIVSVIETIRSTLTKNGDKLRGEGAVNKRLTAFIDQINKGLAGLDKVLAGTNQISRDIFDGFRNQVIESTFDVISFVASDDFRDPLTNTEAEREIFRQELFPAIKSLSELSKQLLASNTQLVGSSDQLATSVFKATPVAPSKAPVVVQPEERLTKFQEIRFKIVNKLQQLTKYKEDITAKERDIMGKLNELRDLKVEKIEAEKARRNAQDLIYRARNNMIKDPDAAMAKGSADLEVAEQKIADLAGRIQLLQNETDIKDAGRTTGKYYSFLGDRFVQDLTGGTYSSYDSLNRQYERMRKAKVELDKYDATEDSETKKVIEEALIAEFTQPTGEIHGKDVSEEKRERDSMLDQISGGLEGSSTSKASITKALFRDVFNSVVDSGGFAGRQLRNLEKFEENAKAKKSEEAAETVKREQTPTEELSDLLGEGDVESLVRQERRKRLSAQVAFMGTPEVKSAVVAIGKVISDLERTGFNPDADFSKYESVDFLGTKLLYKEQYYPTAKAGNAKILQEIRAWYLKYSDGLSKLISDYKREEAQIGAELRSISERMGNAKDAERDTLKARVQVLKNRLNQATRDLLAASGRIKRDLSDLVDGIAAGLGRPVGQSQLSKPVRSDPSMKEKRVQEATDDLAEVQQMLGLESVEGLMYGADENLRDSVTRRTEQERQQQATLSEDVFGEKLKRDPHMLARSLRKARIAELSKLQALEEDIAMLKASGSDVDKGQVAVLEKSKEKIRSNLAKINQAASVAKSAISEPQTVDKSKVKPEVKSPPIVSREVEINTDDLVKRSIDLNNKFNSFYTSTVKPKYEELMANYDSKKSAEVKKLVDELNEKDDVLLEIAKKLGNNPKAAEAANKRAAILDTLKIPDPTPTKDPKAIEARSKAKELAELRLGKISQQLEREQRMREALREYRGEVTAARILRFEQDSKLPPDTEENQAKNAQQRLLHEQQERETLRKLYSDLGAKLKPMLEVIPSILHDKTEQADLFQEFEGMGPAFTFETPLQKKIRQEKGVSDEEAKQKAQQRALRKIEPINYGEFNTDPAYDIFAKQFLARDARAAAKKVQKVVNAAEKARKKRYDAVLQTALLAQKSQGDAEAEARAEGQAVVDEIYRAFMEKQNAEYSEHKASGKAEPFVWVNPYDRDKYLAADSEAERSLRAAVDGALPYLHLDSASRMIGQTSPGQQRNPNDYSHAPQSDTLQVARKLEGTLEYIDDDFLDGKQETERSYVGKRLEKAKNDLNQAMYFAGMAKDPDMAVVPAKNPLDRRSWQARAEALQKDVDRLQSVYAKASDRPWQSAAEALFLKFHGMPGPRKEEQVQKRMRNIEPLHTRPSVPKKASLFRKSSADIMDVLRAACRIAAKDVLKTEDSELSELFVKDFLEEMMLDDGRFGFASPLSKAAAPGDPPKHSDPLNPRETAITLVRLLHHLMQRSKVQNRPKFLQNVREHLVEINPYMLSRKKSNPSAAIGAAMNIIKNVLQSQPPTVISSIMGQLNRML